MLHLLLQKFLEIKELVRQVRLLLVVLFPNVKRERTNS